MSLHYYIKHAVNFYKYLIYLSKMNIKIITNINYEYTI